MSFCLLQNLNSRHWFHFMKGYRNVNATILKPKITIIIGSGAEVWENVAGAFFATTEGS